MASQEQSSLIADFVGRRTWAVVGASADPAKFGNQIFCVLRAAGYRVYGVNPNTPVIDCEPTYATLEALPERPEVVNVVVPPRVTEQIVRQCAALGLTRVWLQPGAESPEAVRYCREHGIAVVYDACAMVHRKIWPS